MSVLVASGANNGLNSTTNVSNSVSCTKLIWVKHSANPTSYNPFLSTQDGAVTNYSELYGGDGSGVLAVHSNSQNGDFSSAPTWGNWNCYIMTAGAASANSLTGYWQDNAGGGFKSKAVTGVSFANARDSIAARGTVNVSMTMAYYMEWSVVLSGAEMTTQFASATPVVQLSNLRRYLALSAASNAGTDTSGNGFNMSVVGTLSDGTGLPFFPITHALGEGSFSLTGSDATWTIGGATSYFQPMAPGAFVLTGAPSYSDFQLDSSPGAFALTGQPAVFSYSQNLVSALSPGAFSLTGQPATFTQASAVNPVGLLPEPPYVIRMPPRDFTVYL